MNPTEERPMTTATKTDLPRMDVSALGLKLKEEYDDDATDEDRERVRAQKAQIYRAVNLYLRDFADTGGVDPVGLSVGSRTHCPNGHALDGFLSSNFRYGIQHGEGFCAFREDSDSPRCGWPCRANHYVKDPDTDEQVMSFYRVLPYHPDLVKRNDEPPLHEDAG